MAKTQINLQDVFLNQVRKENIAVTIYLIGGVQLRGLVRGFDAFTVLLDSPGKPTQLVYKHAITSVVPSRPVSTYRPPDAAARAVSTPVEGAETGETPTENA
ncbi:RNA-binding protein Hfq [bacterium HR16]|nr:RNA-binding protein Hfq [bacterium HR16]